MIRMFIEPERATRWHAGMGKPANVRAGGVAVKPKGVGRARINWAALDGYETPGDTTDADAYIKYSAGVPADYCKFA